MKSTRTFLLLGAAGLLALGSMLGLFDARNSGLVPERPHPRPSPSHSLRSTKALSSQELLQAEPAPSVPACREEDLRQWADSMGLDAMEGALEEVGAIEDDVRRSAAQQALLASWAERDLAGLAAWFGERGAADEIHQQARDMLAELLARSEPEAALAWMEGGLPEPVRQELEGPFFRAWARTEPDAAAAKLRELAGASPDDPRWSDLVGQVAALWAGMDVQRAVAWAQSLEDGAAKAAALQAAGSRWTEAHPQAAAAYAAQRGDADLLQLVAGKWAEIDPRAAAAWVQGLPLGEARDGAALHLASIWSQKDSLAAAAYAASLPAGNARDQAVLAAASHWTYTDPARAAEWIRRFPEGALRTQALEQLMSIWGRGEAQAAGQWLKALPAGPSRDAAMAAYRAAIESSNPGAVLR